MTRCGPVFHCHHPPPFKSAHAEQCHRGFLSFRRLIPSPAHFASLPGVALLLPILGASGVPVLRISDSALVAFSKPSSSASCLKGLPMPFDSLLSFRLEQGAALLLPIPGSPGPSPEFAPGDPAALCNCLVPHRCSQTNSVCRSISVLPLSFQLPPAGPPPPAGPRRAVVACPPTLARFASRAAIRSRKSAASSRSFWPQCCFKRCQGILRLLSPSPACPPVPVFAASNPYLAPSCQGTGESGCSSRILSPGKSAALSKSSCSSAEPNNVHITLQSPAPYLLSRPGSSAAIPILADSLSQALFPCRAGQASWP